MVNLIIICTTIFLCFLSYLIFKSKEIYVDEIVSKGPIVNSYRERVGEYVRYKRTYKNGKVTFFEKNY